MKIQDRLLRPRGNPWTRAIPMLALLALANFLPAQDKPQAPPAIKPPRPLSGPQPEFPPNLREKQIGGKVELLCTIDAEGKVKNIKIQSATEPEFGEAAAAAVSEWTFEPGRKNGQPSEFEVLLPLAFALPLSERLQIAANRPLWEDLPEVPVPAEKLPSIPMPRQTFKPEYPAALKGTKTKGKVIISIVINKEGQVVHPLLIRTSHPEFVEASLFTAIRLQFDPVKNKQGEVVLAVLQLQYEFSEG